MPTPMSSPTGASCSEARSIDDAAHRDVDAAAARRCAAAASSASPSAFSRSAGSVVVADVDGGEPCRPRETRAALGERVGDLLDAVEAAGPSSSAPSIAARGPASVTLPSSTLKTSVESAPAKRRAVRLEEVERLLGLGARDREVVGGLAAGAGGGAEQDDDDDRGERGCASSGG